MQNLWDYSKRGRDLSASNLAASQKRMEQEQYDKDNAFNPVNAAVAAAMAYFTGGGSLTLPNVATSALVAATAPRGKEDIVGSAIGGYTKTAGLQDIGKAVGEGGIQSLATPENAAKVAGTVQAWQNKPEEAYASLSQPKPQKQLTDFDKTMLNVYTNILSSDKSTDEARSEAAKSISKIFSVGKSKTPNLTGGAQQPQQPEQMVTNFPQGTQQAFQNTAPAVQNIVPQLQQMMRPQAPSQPEGEMFSPTLFQTKPDVKEQLSVEKAQAENKAMKATASGSKQASSIFTEIQNAQTRDQLNQITKRFNQYLDYAPDVQKELRKAVDTREQKIIQDENQVYNRGKAAERSVNDKQKEIDKEKKSGSNWEKLKPAQREVFANQKTTSEQFSNFASKLKNMPENLMSMQFQEKVPNILKGTGVKDFLSANALLLSNIARNYGGEKGVLSDPDMERIKQALPQVTDSYKQKVIKYNNIVDLINERVSIVKQAYGLSDDQIPFDTKPLQKISLKNKGGNQGVPFKRVQQTQVKPSKSMKVGRFTVEVQ